MEAEALLFSNSKRKTNEESKAENDTAIAEQQNNIGILLFIYVLHYFSACFHLFLRSSLNLYCGCVFTSSAGQNVSHKAYVHAP